MEKILIFLNNKIVLTIIGAVSGIVITHLFYKSKLKKEQKVRFENVIGEKIATSLSIIRDVERKASVQEIYDIENQLTDSIMDEKLSDFPIYPEILDNHAALVEYYSEVIDARKEYGKNVDYVTAAYLLFMDRYLFRLITFLKSFDELVYPAFGTIFIIDIQRWQKDFDRWLIKQLNESNVKLYSHSGKEWEKTKNKIMNKYWNDCFLKKVSTDKYDGLSEEGRTLLNNILETEVYNKLINNDNQQDEQKDL